MSMPCLHSKTRLIAALSCFLLPIAATSLWAGQGSLTTPAAHSGPAFDNDSIYGMSFRPIGPAVMGGRVTAIAVVDFDPRIFYLGTASGNLWKTTNYGTTFEPLFERQSTASIGAVALAPSNPEVVWVGTGEANNRQSSPWGEGVFRSLDGGRTWRDLGLRETRHIGRIVVHPEDPDVAYVAALGHLWGPNPERGVFLTRDGGLTWRKVLYVDENTGAADLVMDPKDPSILLAALYQRRRTSFGFNGGGPGSGIYKTVDGGEQWREVTNGLPGDPKGRIGLAIHPERLYAVVEAHAGGVFRSSDQGESWEWATGLNPRPMYFSKLRVDPKDPDRLWLLGIRLHLSTDGGRQFSEDSSKGVHPDHHDLWIDAADSNRMLLAGDGGLSLSFDGGESWRMVDNLPIAQYYKIGVDNAFPYNVYGCLQDNGTWTGPSATRDSRGIRNADWSNVHGGDGFYAQVPAHDPEIVFAQSQRGQFVRVDQRTGERQWIQPAGEDPDSRWNWSSPLVLSKHDLQTIYVGANVLYRSRHGGQSWTPISPDLTRAIDRSRLTIMGIGEKEMLSRHDGVSYYGTLTSISESPLDPLLLYVGTDDGRLQRTLDGGLSWVDLSSRLPGLPERALISRVQASGFQPGRVYASADAHQEDDYRTYVYASQDFGETWKPIAVGLPESPVNVLIEHPRNPGLLFLGNEIGVYFSLDQGKRWQRLQLNLPTVPVDDLVVHPRENDLVVGTHGRGIWILDDLRPMEDWRRLSEAGGELFQVRAASSFHVKRPQAWTGNSEFAAPNPPFGALIRYRVGSLESPPALAILDSDRRVLQRFVGEARPGLHQVVWDLRYPSLAQHSESSVRRSRSIAGPLVLPGVYRVRMEVEGSGQEVEILVRRDHRIDVSAEDLELRHKDLLRLYQARLALEDLNEAGGRINKAIRELVADRRDLAADLLAEAHSIRNRTRSILDALPAEKGAIDRLFSRLEGVSAPLSEEQRGAVDGHFQRALTLVEVANDLMDRLPALYRGLRQPLPDPAVIRPLAFPQH